MNGTAQTVAHRDYDRKQHGTLPDIRAAKLIPIELVVDGLGLDREDKRFHCWRPDAHEHDDRTASASIWQRRNRVRCHRCDTRALSTVDLVMAVLDLPPLAALEWLADRFQLPRIRAKPGPQPRPRFTRSRACVGGRLENLIRSGVFAELSSVAVRILNAIDAHTDPLTHTAEDLDYAALGVLAGVAKESRIAKAIRQLEFCHIIQVTRSRAAQGRPLCNRYTLTLEDSRLLQEMNATRVRKEDQIRFNREAKAQRLRLHRSQPAAQDVPV